MTVAAQLDLFEPSEPSEGTVGKHVRWWIEDMGGSWRGDAEANCSPCDSRAEAIATAKARAESFAREIPWHRARAAEERRRSIAAYGAVEGGGGWIAEESAHKSQCGRSRLGGCE